MEADSYLVLSTLDQDPGYYVQFAQGGPAGFRSEAIGNDNLYMAS